MKWVLNQMSGPDKQNGWPTQRHHSWCAASINYQKKLEKRICHQKRNCIYIWVWCSVNNEITTSWHHDISNCDIWQAFFCVAQIQYSNKLFLLDWLSEQTGEEEAIIYYQNLQHFPPKLAIQWWTNWTVLLLQETNRTFCILQYKYKL